MAAAIRLLRPRGERRALKKYVIPAAILLLAAAGWFYGRKPDVPTVPFAKVVQETLISALPTNGKVEPFEWSMARAEGPGIIDRIVVREGQKVRQGDVLATLRLSGIQPDQAAAEAQIAQAQARLTEIERGGHSAELAEIAEGLRRARSQKETPKRELDWLPRLAGQTAPTPGAAYGRR